MARSSLNRVAAGTSALAKAQVKAVLSKAKLPRSKKSYASEIQQAIYMKEKWGKFVVVPGRGGFGYNKSSWKSAPKLLANVVLRYIKGYLWNISAYQRLSNGPRGGKNALISKVCDGLKQANIVFLGLPWGDPKNERKIHEIVGRLRDLKKKNYFPAASEVVHGQRELKEKCQEVLEFAGVWVEDEFEPCPLGSVNHSLLRDACEYLQDCPFLKEH